MSEVARIELDAVYREGVFRPLVTPALAEGAHVHLVVEAPPATSLDPLQLVGSVYDGLTPAGVAEIEALTFDRSRFLGR
jgi:predicted DNA-binding antitoxin AbrB/MazE fold protein